MEYDIKTWPYRWFGVWKEYGSKYQRYPSIKNFISKGVNSTYDVKRLKNYLDNGRVVASTSRHNFPSPFDGVIKTGTISFKTDGLWVWLEDISEFIIYNNLVIPIKWYEEIKKRDFTIPNLCEKDIQNIEWPTL